MKRPFPTTLTPLARLRARVAGITGKPCTLASAHALLLLAHPEWKVPRGAPSEDDRWLAANPRVRAAALDAGRAIALLNAKAVAWVRLIGAANASTSRCSR